MKKITAELAGLPSVLREQIIFQQPTQETPPMAEQDHVGANLARWNTLKAVDRAFTKPITGKAYKGDSPNPTWMIRKATEQLGPIGEAWGFTVIEEKVLQGRPVPVTLGTTDTFGPPATEGGAPVLLKREKTSGFLYEQYHQVLIRFWFKTADGRTKGEYDAFGGTPMLIFTKRGEWSMDEDAAKKSLTDAYTKGLSWLGVAADLFLGLFDDKYTSSPADAPQTDQSSSAVADASASTERAQAPAQTAAKAEERKTTQPAGW